MGKAKNIVCEPSDIFRDLKIKIMELISLNKVICNNLPNLQIPSTLPSMPSINPSQAVIDFLKDILAVIQGINFDQMRMQLIDWLVEQVEPLEKSLVLNLKLALKDCYACKTNPTIPEWMFRYIPSQVPYVLGEPDFTNAPEGVGINIELKKLDLTCLFSVNPNSPAGKLLYDGDIYDDMNRFLWEVIQDNNNSPNSPRLWVDPLTSKPIAWFSYLEDSNIAYIEDSTGDGQQDSDPRPMVFKMQIDNSYSSKTLITFLNDYMNSQNPLFDADKLIPNTIDFIYGTITNKIQMPEECIANNVEFEKSIEDYINAGIDNPEITLDDSFYEFSPAEMVNIKERINNKKLGTKEFDHCCNRQKAKVSFDTLEKLEKDVKNTSTLNEKISVFQTSMNSLAGDVAEGVSDADKNGASADFFANFIVGIQIALVKMTLSPKILILVHSLHYLVNGQLSDKIKIKELLKVFECIIRAILEDLIKKLIYEFLLPLIIQALKDLIICIITKKLKEKYLYKIMTMVSLLPGEIADKIEKLNELMGKGGSIVDSVQGFTNQINLNSLNNLDLRGGNKGKFCD